MGTKTSKFKILITGGAKGFTSSIYKSQAAVRGFNKELDASARMASQLDRGLTSMAGRFTALFGGLSAGLATSALWDAGVAAEKLDKQFIAITGSAAAAKDELDFVRNLADGLGQVFPVVANDFKDISAAAKGTALEGRGVRDIFRGIMEASTALGMSADDTSGALKAISQMISKGSVQAEELRGQLSERLAGSFQLMARAMGVSTQKLNKMLEQGQVAANDALPKLARALHEQYGQAAADASHTAQAAINRFKTAWFDLKVAVAKSGFMDVAVDKINAITAALKDPAVQQAIVNWAKRFFELAEAVFNFVRDHGKLLAQVGATALALGALNRIIFALTGVWRGLNTAMLAMTGMRLVPWLMELRAATIAAAAGTTALSVAFKAFLAVAAIDAVFKIGKLVAVLWDWRQATVELAAAQARAKAQKEWIDPRIADRLAEINQSLGTSYRTMDELFAAQKRGEVAYNDLTGTWVKGAEEMAAAAKKSASEQKQGTGAALAEMKRQYQQYADEVKRIQDEIAGREKSLAEQLRAMGRSGMSDIDAWRDRKKEAQEYEQAAKKAAEAGNFEQAVKLADQAKAAYADLNREVKDGDQVIISRQEALQTAMDGVKRAGELAIATLKQQQDAAAKMMDDLEGKSGMQDLSKGMDESKRKWLKNWQAMRDATMRELDQVEQRIRKITTDRHMTIYVNERVKKALGGMVGLRAGGRLPGYGGGDRIQALLEAGEFVIRKEAVARFGAGFFAALNSLKLPSMPRFAAGGPVGAGAAPAGVVNINLTMPTGNSYQVQSDPMTADKMLRDIARMRRLRSGA